eukprot:scaffold179459_cov18-Tisochrysis_lutea.AAC.1
MNGIQSEAWEPHPIQDPRNAMSLPGFSMKVLVAQLATHKALEPNGAYPGTQHISCQDLGFAKKFGSFVWNILFVKQQKSFCAPCLPHA